RSLTRTQPPPLFPYTTLFRSPQPSFSDLTRWRRKPLPELLQAEPTTPGERLRHRRLELRLSQEEVGSRFGIGRASIGRWERGERSEEHTSELQSRGHLVCRLL